MSYACPKNTMGARQRPGKKRKKIKEKVPDESSLLPIMSKDSSANNHHHRQVNVILSSTTVQVNDTHAIKTAGNKRFHALTILLDLNRKQVILCKHICRIVYPIDDEIGY